MANSDLINGVLIPAALLLVGTLIVKIEWLPFAVVLAGVLGAWKVLSAGQLNTC
jgi:cytochrome-b5 reductase